MNRVPPSPIRTRREIVRANVLTPVNGIISVMLVVILVASPGPDALFAGVIVSNSVIGIVQELRARRVLQRVAVLTTPRARVVREGEVCEVALDAVVEDDVLDLGPGDQAVVDGVVLTSEGLEMNEALLTGESDPVLKQPGDGLLSGSFVTAGSGRYRATRVGSAAYAATLAEQARRYAVVDSELRRGVNLVLRWLVWIIPPVTLLLAWRLARTEQDWREAVRGTVAAAVAMVPDGLVLLTSLAFIVGIVSLSRRHALMRELAAVELLARVDVLCLDKTGTITTGAIAFADLHILDAAFTAADIHAALGVLAAADPHPNATLAAIGARFTAPPDVTIHAVTPFSSSRKWAGVETAERGTLLLGAPDVLAGDDPAVRRAVEAHTAAGRRLLLVARSDDPLRGDRLPIGRRPVALAVLEDAVRADAPEILAYFAQQHVALKVISGDHPATVAAVARRAGLDFAGDGIDARALPDDPEAFADMVDSHTVFGRVTPEQKRVMVHALQRRGHVVAMTGDGVNDVLALKDADMGIAMGAGSAATRAVAELVLLDNRFASLPAVVAEGRRVINSVERAANLFIVGTTYSVLLAGAVVLSGVEFPFYPRHLTVVRVFSIGVPGLFLALAPNARRVAPGFIRRVLGFSLPAGAVAAAATFTVYEVTRRSLGGTLAEARTAATLTLLGVALVVLARLARPLTPLRVALVAAMAGGYVVVLVIAPLRDFFAFDIPDRASWAATGIGVALAAAVLHVGPRLVPAWRAADSAQALPTMEPSEMTKRSSP